MFRYQTEITVLMEAALDLKQISVIKSAMHLPSEPAPPGTAARGLHRVYMCVYAYEYDRS